MNLAITSWVLSVSAALASGQQPAANPAGPPPSNPGGAGLLITTTTVKPVAPGEIGTADELLTALETADKSLRTLQADVAHVKRESELVGNRVQEERGKLYYRVEPAAPGDANSQPRKKFQVDFEDLIFDNTRRKENHTFIFDGQWLVEKQPDEKQIFKRQLAPPGQTMDPLALGEGQFPIPIGQKKSRINERFDASIVPPQEEFPAPPGSDPNNPPPPPDWVKDSYQLKLIPKKGTSEFRDYREIRIWYRKGDLLPRMARTVNIDDSSDDVVLSQVVTNKDLPAGVFDTSVPEGWNAEISEYRAQKADE